MTDSEPLFPGESRTTRDRLTGLRYLRAGEPGRDLYVFLPGGGHLARVAYGHPGAAREDFLDFWLDQAGDGLLALSYPSDHPAIGVVSPDVTISEWSRWVASEVGAAALQAKAGRVIILLWSMAGRCAAALNVAMQASGRRAFCMISLAATPPLPGMLAMPEGGEPLTKEGYWALGPRNAPPNHRLAWFRAALALQEGLCGHAILDADDYAHHYLCNTPVMLRGERQRSRGGRLAWSAREMIEDLAIERCTNGSLVGMIVPTHPGDAAHGIRDHAGWSHLNALAILDRLIGKGTLGPQVPAALWEEALEASRSVPARLLRWSAGGHLFFLGDAGARAAAAHIRDLVKNIAGIEHELSALAACLHEHC